MKIRLAIRGFADGQRRFEEFVDIDGTELDSILPGLAEKHASALASLELHMIEIEFLDEPDINQRYFRFGTDPRAMVAPMKVNL